MVGRARSIRISEELEKAILLLAEKEDRSFNKMVSILVKEALEKRGVPIKQKTRAQRFR